MNITEENVHMLLSMGFPHEGEIRRALKMGNNDLSEAVAILTNENPTSSFENIDDVEMKDADTEANSTVTYGPHRPPPAYENYRDYEQVPMTMSVDSDRPGGTATQTEGEGKSSEEAGENGLEFPVGNLYELEGRVFTESWSIPYKKEESLGKCLVACTRLAQENLCETDQDCKRFIERCMPEAFNKLLTSGAVHRWGLEIQEGIYDMLQLLVDLVATRLQHQPVPLGLMEVLAVAFNPDTEYHTKNKSRRPEKIYWEDKFGVGKAFATSPPPGSFKDAYGWLTSLINRFAEKKGFTHVKEQLTFDNFDAPTLASLLAPFGNCAEFLNPEVVQPLLSPGMETSVKFLQNLEENELKDKKVGCVFDMLGTMKLLCVYLWPHDVDGIDDLRLEFVLRMLKAPHFNARMNALKEVTRLIEDSCSTKPSKSSMSNERILDWLLDKKVLSISLEGNIDQVQYCEKIKNIVDFLGHKLSIDELTKIWKMQTGERSVVIDNIQSVIAAAGVKFNAQQLEHLFLLIQKSWQVENDKIREKLLGLIGKVGREARNYKTTNRVLELLWDLAHLPALPLHLIELALEEHLAILNDSYMVKEQVKKHYVSKCVEDIKEGKWVLPALKQLLQIVKNVTKHSMSKAEKGILQELNRNYEIIKLVTNSLIKFHQLAVQNAPDGKLTEYTLVDGRYFHKDYVTVHLQFLQFMLQEGVLYLPCNRARDIWTTLVAANDACHWDKETCFEWFTKGIADLEQDTQSQLFQKEFLRFDTGKITSKGFACFRHFFENVNLLDHRLKKNGNIWVVEKPDLLGRDYLWELCLNTPDKNLAEASITLLLNMSYSNLSIKLKKDPVVLHKKFIDECYRRLETAMIPLGGSAVAQVLSLATQVLTAVSMPESVAVPSPSKSANLLNLERLLLIAERYILCVEELHIAPRTIAPHGASYQGQLFTMHCVSESPKMEFPIKAHSNESLGSVRQKIAFKLKHPPEQVQIVANDKMLTKDQKLMHQLHLEDNQQLSVRTYGSVSSVSSSLSSTQDLSSAGTAKQIFDLEQEKQLPGVVMASGGQVFEMLYQLADLDDPRITTRARSLLKLIPTDPTVQDILDSLGQKQVLRQPSPDISPKASPRSSPRKFVLGPVPPPPPKQTAKEAFRCLFDASMPDMSTFRVLYNLEVLSSKLMPTSRDAGTLQSAKNFCEEFLTAGGLNLVVNILQREAVPPDVDYKTRQGCYAISLQLLRFLLCGQEVSGEILLSTHCRRHSSGSHTSMSGTTGSGPPSLEVTPAAGSRAIQTMSVNDFTEMVACFMRVCWASAAGKLHLAATSQPLRDNNSMTSSTFSSGSGRSRQSSTGSTASTGSESESLYLHPGVCIRQSQVSARDTHIAKESLELLVTCLQMRSPLLVSFYSLPSVSDFITDIVVGATQAEIREAALEQFTQLSQVELHEAGSHQQSPKQFILQILLKARLPFWVPSGNTRGTSQRLLRQCTQYFELRCRLLDGLSDAEQNELQVNVARMLEDEMAWLTNYVPSEHGRLKELDNTLIAAHLRLIRTLLTCVGSNKREIGKALSEDLLHEFLFPASKIIMDDLLTQTKERCLLNVSPKCSTSESRVAAYKLLVELADGCVDNLEDICQMLSSMHHQVDPETGHRWDYMPPVDSRSAAGFVGLKNGGATCYMNSVIQQLYMTPGLAEAVLSVDDENLEEDSVLYQMQQVYGHLQESQLQYYLPEKFWKVFKLWGQEVNIREQQDALDFYQALIDQMDEQLKKLGKEAIFKNRFQGVFSDQKICKDCPHRYEQEEVFFALNVTVKNTTLQDSLDQFVKGELLEGDNAYFCEKCGEKRNTIKRMCIKSLPPLLCIHLKRFDYDWEANKALKFDDYFKFPWILDMEPYTTEGMMRREEMEQKMQESSSSDDGESTLVINTSISSKQINYELAGVVVHSGQANAGHYYSFIKDRRGNYMTNQTKGKWFKFNDTHVEEFDMSDAALDQECFGGKYKAKVYDQLNSYPEERLRYWNGYLLFYEKVEEVRSPMSAKKTKVLLRKSSNDASSTRRNSDSLVELTELVHKGEKKGLFSDKMSSRIERLVREENLRFMKNRDVYNTDYFTFIREIVSVNSKHTGLSQYEHMCLHALQLALNFLFNTFYRTRSKLRMNCTDAWVSAVGDLLQSCKPACSWMVEYLSTSGSSYIKPLLLECPTKEIRGAFAKILENLMSSFYHHGGMPTHKCLNELIELLLDMLGRDVTDNVKNSQQYFQVLACYIQMGTKPCSHMFGRHAFQRFCSFLLGTPPTTQTEDTAVRRWSSIQARDFAHLHAAMAMLILNCNISPYITEDVDKFIVRKPTTVTPQIYLKMAPDMVNHVFGSAAPRYIREVVLALREVTTAMPHVEDMLVYCSFCNLPFSTLVLKNIMTHFAGAPSGELKGILSALVQLLLLEDSLQLRRLQCVIDGYVDDQDHHYDGMLEIIKSNHLNDSRRSYQCIKFLVNLANQCPLAKDYLIQSSTKWKWAVDWLRKKMSESYWPSQPSATTSNEDSNTKSFQRTISAQDTLAEATALLTELEAVEHLEMETNNQETSSIPDNKTSQAETPEVSEPKTEDIGVDEVDERL